MAKGKGNTRTTGREQYYTPAGTAQRLVDFVLTHTGADGSAAWLEPAAGTGSFLDALTAHGVYDVTAFDIEPKRDGITAANFLDVTLPARRFVTITNPPFGRNNALSVRFFNRCAAHSDLIAFIVPRSWRKWTVVNRLDPNFAKIADLDIAVTYQDDAGDDLTQSNVLNTVFQIWMRQPVPRPRFPHPTPTPVFTVASPADADAAITMFGRTAGTIHTEFERVKNTTRLFINAEPHMIEALQATDLSPFYRQVAYVEALAQPEIHYAVHATLRGESVPADFLVTNTLLSGPGNPIPEPLRTGQLDEKTRLS